MHTSPVEFSKVDAATQRELPKAKLQIVGEDNDFEYSWTSSDKPEIVDLAPGNYIFREIEAPEGYNVAAEIKFTITTDDAMSDVLRTITMEDTSRNVKFFTNFDVTIEKKWVNDQNEEIGWPEGVDKIAVKLQYRDKEKGWTDYLVDGKPLTIEIGKGEKGTFADVPAMFDNEKAVYRVVEMTKVDGYSSAIVGEDGSFVSTEADISGSEFDMVLTNKKNPTKEQETPKVTPPGTTPPGTVPDGKIPESPDTPDTPVNEEVPRTNPSGPSVPSTTRRVVTPSTTQVSRATSTGDGNNVVLWIVLAAVAASAAVGAAVMVYRRRRED